MRDEDLTSSGDCCCSSPVKHDARVCHIATFILFIMGYFQNGCSAKKKKSTQLTFTKSNYLSYHHCIGLRASKSLT